MAKRKKKGLSPVIYLLALLGPIFGIIFYFVFRDADKEKATNLLILSIVIPLIITLFAAVPGLYYFKTSQNSNTSRVIVDKERELPFGSYYIKYIRVFKPVNLSVSVDSNETVKVTIYNPEVCKEHVETELLYTGPGVYVLGTGKKMNETFYFNETGLWCITVFAYEGPAKFHLKVTENYLN